MEYYVATLEKLIEQFRRMPGIGRKMAVRMAFYILSLTQDEADEFASAVSSVKRIIKRCKVCQNFSEGELCSVCTSDKRDRSVVCVMENAKDVAAFEKTGEYNGLYHILHGVISPLDGVAPEDINIKELVDRVKDCEIKEIIMATNPDVEGEATAMYICRLLKPFGVKVTRLAHGLPVGGDLEFTDQATLGKAVAGRYEMN